MGGKLLAVSADPPQQSAKVVQKHRLNFAILSDSDLRVMRAFGVVHSGGGPKGEDIAIPSHFLIGRDGRIVWRFISSRVQDRVDPSDLLSAVRAHFPRNE